jgi:hypothetical protein
MEYAVNRAKAYIGNACQIYGTFNVASTEFNVSDAAYYMLKNTSGLMVFDIVHVINNNCWTQLKTGISRFLSEE